MYLPLLDSKGVTDQIRKTHHHLQKLLFPRTQIIGHCRFHHMACRIELMAFAQVAPALPGLFDGKISVQVAVLTLGLCYDVDHLIRRALQCFILLRRKGKSHCLQPFGHIRILEHGSVNSPSHRPAAILKFIRLWLGSASLILSLMASHW